MGVGRLYFTVTCDNDHRDSFWKFVNRLGIPKDMLSKRAKHEFQRWLEIPNPESDEEWKNGNIGDIYDVCPYTSESGYYGLYGSSEKEGNSLQKEAESVVAATKDLEGFFVKINISSTYVAGESYNYLVYNGDVICEWKEGVYDMDIRDDGVHYKDWDADDVECENEMVSKFIRRFDESDAYPDEVK